MSDDSHFSVERLDPDKHRRDEFRCESLELTEFFHRRARKEMEVRASACFVLVSAVNRGRVVGFYTLSQTSVKLAELPPELAKKLPRYPELGATLIGRLARDLDWKGQGIGQLLLLDALRRSLSQSQEVAAVVVVTDPKDTKAREFYTENGFVALDHRRLFIPMQRLIKWEARGWGV